MRKTYRPVELPRDLEFRRLHCRRDGQARSITAYSAGPQQLDGPNGWSERLWVNAIFLCPCGEPTFINALFESFGTRDAVCERNGGFGSLTAISALLVKKVTEEAGFPADLYRSVQGALRGYSHPHPILADKKGKRPIQGGCPYTRKTEDSMQRFIRILYGTPFGRWLA
ncbi:MAG: hypothetical protein ABFS46_16845 [Myxococcota bacterium]